MVNKSRSGGNEAEISELQAQGLARLKFADGFSPFNTPFDKIIQDAFKTKVVSGQGGSLYRIKPGRVFAYSAPSAAAAYTGSSWEFTPPAAEEESKKKDTESEEEAKKRARYPAIQIEILIGGTLTASTEADLGLKNIGVTDSLEATCLVDVENYEIKVDDYIAIDSAGYVVIAIPIELAASGGLESEAGVTAVNIIGASNDVSIDTPPAYVAVTLNITKEDFIALVSQPSVIKIKFITPSWNDLSLSSSQTTVAVNVISVVNSVSADCDQTQAPTLKTAFQIKPYGNINANTLVPTLTRVHSVTGLSSANGSTPAPTFILLPKVIKTDSVSTSSDAEFKMSGNVIVVNSINANTPVPVLFSPMQQITRSGEVSASTLCVPVMRDFTTRTVTRTVEVSASTLMPAPVLTQTKHFITLGTGANQGLVVSTDRLVYQTKMPVTPPPDSVQAVSSGVVFTPVHYIQRQNDMQASTVAPAPVAVDPRVPIAGESTVAADCLTPTVHCPVVYVPPVENNLSASTVAPAPIATSILRPVTATSTVSGSTVCPVPTTIDFGTEIVDGVSSVGAGTPFSSGDIAVSLVDTTGPSVTFTITPPAFSTTGLSTRTVNLNIVASDVSGIKGFFKNETGVLPGSPVLTAQPATHTFTTDGLKTLYLWVWDNLDNVTLVSATVTIDATLPVVTISAVTNEINNRTVNCLVTSTITESGVGIKDYWLGEEPNDVGGPRPPTSGWVLSKPTIMDPVQFSSGDGQKTLTLFCRDNYGNVGEDSWFVEIDTVGPTSTSFTITPTPITTAAVWNGLCAIHWQGSDTANSVNRWCVTTTSAQPAIGSFTAVSAAPTVTYNGNYTAPTVNGTQTFWLWLADNVGNIGPSRTTTAVLDFTVPTVSVPTLDRVYVNRTQTLTISSYTATDSGVGLHSSPYCLVADSATLPTSGWSSFKPTSFNSNNFSAGDGTKYLYLWTRDAYGNATMKILAGVVVDTAIPSVGTVSCRNTGKNCEYSTGYCGADVQAGTTATVAVVWTVSSSVSPIEYGWIANSTATPTNWSSTKPSQIVYTFGTGGTVTFHMWARDAAGNSDHNSGTIIMNRVRPTSTTPTLSDAGSQNVNITNWTGTCDAQSGSTSVYEWACVPSGTNITTGCAFDFGSKPSQYTGFSSPGTYTLLFTVKDRTGMISLTKAASVTLA